MIQFIHIVFIPFGMCLSRKNNAYKIGAVLCGKEKIKRQIVFKLQTSKISGMGLQISKTFKDKNSLSER